MITHEEKKDYGRWDCQACGSHFWGYECRTQCSFCKASMATAVRHIESVASICASRGRSPVK
jgi:hypothetical protein